MRAALCQKLRALPLCRWAKWCIMRLSLFHPRFSQRPYWLYLLTSLSQKRTRSYRITETHTHARVMHYALCCSRFSVVVPPSARPVCSRLSDMTVPAGLLAAAEQGGGERERIQERKRDGDTAGQCEERMQGGRRWEARFAALRRLFRSPLI